MSITINGNWVVSVKYKQPPALPQRFIIAGALSGNGTYEGIETTPSISVIGSTWIIIIQANESYEFDGAWINSRMRKTALRQENGFNIFDIESEDTVDSTWNDLILELKQPIPIVIPPPPPIIIVPPDPPVIIVPPPPPPDPVVVVPPPEPIPLGKVYTRFNNDEMFRKMREDRTYGIWANENSNLIEYYTSSLQNKDSSSLSVYDKKFGSNCSNRMFDITYGHIDGSGSVDLGGKDHYSLSNAVYSQYANLTNNTIFQVDGKEIKHFYVINVTRDRYGDQLNVGQTEINLKQLNGSLFSNRVYTGSNVRINPTGNIIRIIDDQTGNLVSGSLEDGIFNSSSPHYYGLMFPKLGVWLLDADILNMSASFNTVTGSDISGNNKHKLFTSLSGSGMFIDESGDFLGLKSRKFRTEHLDKYFVRIKNFDYNHSNNPTWVSGSDQIIKSDFSPNPKTYVTEIGLYDDNYELIAVGKINKPKQKNYTTEGLYTVTLKYD